MYILYVDRITLPSEGRDSEWCVSVITMIQSVSISGSHLKHRDY